MESRISISTGGGGGGINILKEGYLSKKGHFIQSWKSRWHVLLPNSLEYYENETKSIKKGGVSINPSTIVRIINDQNHFIVQTGEETLEISASNSIERDSWIKAIQETINLNLVRIIYRDCLTVNHYANVETILGQILADGFVSYGSQNKSNFAFTHQIQFFWKLIPDLKWEIQELLVDGNKVIVRSLASGSPRGDFIGVTGLDGSKSFQITTIDIHTIENGKIKYVHHLEDWGSAIEQLRH
mmetsp:Transcript_6377/g.6654  ORF Transcript_6377/g.6654 Transcript_6377/m.6654 type:complete len:242 (-) Transcript_6377:105-830(-)